MSSLKGASSSDMSLKTDVEGGPLEPHKGTDLFGTFSEKKDTGLVLKGTSSAPQTPASTSVLENIRRYRWLWQKAGEAYKAGNEEEYRFLMEEAAHALAGEPLRVAVPASALPILDEGQQEEFLELRTRIQGKKVELEGLGARHMSCEDTHVVLKNQLAAAEKEVQSLNRELGIAEKEGFMDKVVKLQEDIASKMRNEKPPEKKDPVREALEKERQEKEKKRQDCLARILKVKEELRKADAELNKIENEEKQAQKGLKEEEQKFQDFMKKLP
jgi:hypothetical protein